ncbi:MAG: DUF418 domain-containing protein [Rhodothermales bacterium]|nr:DUF418 domain-containing protein [Rhodothermales bacterium]MBO6778229.1 DUF418 domain-containing protein [Rhodothermales bacterium]
METRLAPVSEKQRILSLDVLRGFALLGILTMNIGSFSMPEATYFDPTAYGELVGLNGWVWRLTHLLGDLKFMAIFSMLFGAGIVLADQRAEARGRPSAGLHYRRVGWLIVFGLLHAHLLWYGDILYWYGVCGMVVYLFRRVSAPWLIVWGLVSLGVTSGIMLGAGASVPFWPPEVLAEINADLKPSDAVKAAEIAAFQGGWLEQMSHRVPKALEMQTNTLLFWAFWRVSGLMLLGMALFKLGVFSAARTTRFYVALIVVAVVVGLPVIAYGIRYNFANDWEAPYFFFYGLQFNYWASVLVSLGWVGGVMLVCRANLTRLTRPLAAVGRTAFSNYILQTVICTTLFYGHGFGLFGQVDRVTQAVIVLAIWAFQLAISPLWLRHFRFGPLEWLWRSLVYLKRQPFRLATS